jgi:hypothetical protein
VLRESVFVVADGVAVVMLSLGGEEEVKVKFGTGSAEKKIQFLVLSRVDN